MKFENAYFGLVDIDPADHTFIKRSAQVNGKNYQLKLFMLDQVGQNPDFVKATELWLAQLEQTDQIARAHIMSSYESGNSLINEFIDFHLEEVLEPIQEKLGLDKIDHKTFLNHLDLCGVSVTVRDGALGFGCDYSIGKSFVDELLVVNFDAAGELIDITHES